MNEITILQQLQDAGVCGIPHFMGGGDLVGFHHTAASYKFKDEKWRTGSLSLTCRKHYRFLVGMLDHSLEEFDNPQQLLQLLKDAFDGMLTCSIRSSVLCTDIWP